MVPKKLVVYAMGLSDENPLDSLFRAIECLQEKISESLQKKRNIDRVIDTVLTAYEEKNMQVYQMFAIPLTNKRHKKRSKIISSIEASLHPNKFVSTIIDQHPQPLPFLQILYSSLALIRENPAIVLPDGFDEDDQTRIMSTRINMSQLEINVGVLLETFTFHRLFSEYFGVEASASAWQCPLNPEITDSINQIIDFNE